MQLSIYLNRFWGLGNEGECYIPPNTQWQRTIEGAMTIEYNLYKAEKLSKAIDNFRRHIKVWHYLYPIVKETRKPPLGMFYPCAALHENK